MKKDTRIPVKVESLEVRIRRTSKNVHFSGNDYKTPKERKPIKARVEQTNRVLWLRKFRSIMQQTLGRIT